jgi:Ca2+-binding RTX toxin-like protein
MSVNCATAGSCMASGSRGTVISTANSGGGWSTQGTGTARALRAMGCLKSSTCITGGDAGAILGVSRSALPEISIDDVNVTEGDSGTTNADFKVSLSAPSSDTVQVDYRTNDGTAGAPADYAAQPTTTLNFTPGQTEKTVSVPVNGDTADEPDETFTVDLSAADHASIADLQGTGTIVDDDLPVPTPAPPQVPQLPVSAPDCSQQRTGTAGADTFTGTAGGDLLLGMDGSDRLNGLEGPDCVFGGHGDDVLLGGPGDDLLRGGDGRDIVSGGPDDDVMSGGRGPDRVSGGGGNDQIRVQDIGHDRVLCGAGHDRVTINPGDHVAADCERVQRVG